jgi:hypothetical protein
MQERKIQPRPFQNSLSALAQVALRETGADGYAYFRKDPDRHTLLRLDAFGIGISEDSVANATAGVVPDKMVIYKIGADGILAFVFQEEARSRQARPRLDRIAASIEAVWSAAKAAGRYSALANEVAEMEAHLMDSRIADRVRGLLGDSGEASPVEAIARHVEAVLRPAATGRMLEELSRNLEEEVEERRLTNRAKAILRSVHGMSEEQAHTHLRQISRKTRRKLKNVALDLIENRPGKERR